MKMHKFISLLPVKTAYTAGARPKFTEQWRECSGRRNRLGSNHSDFSFDQLSKKEPTWLFKTWNIVVENECFVQLGQTDICNFLLYSSSWRFSYNFCQVHLFQGNKWPYPYGTNNWSLLLKWNLWVYYSSWALRNLLSQNYSSP